MAERLDTPIRPQPRRSKYPWDEWADGSAWRIVRGTDYEVPSVSMAAVIRAEAVKRNLAATANAYDDRVEFQFRALEAAA